MLSCGTHAAVLGHACYGTRLGHSKILGWKQSEESIFLKSYCVCGLKIPCLFVQESDGEKRVNLRLRRLPLGLQAGLCGKGT